MLVVLGQPVIPAIVGTNDIIAEGWSVECKYGARLSYQQLLDACKQAEGARENPNDIAVAVVKRKGDRLEDALFVMRAGEFRECYL